MNWKEYPYLFANGKFKFKDPEGWIWDIVGIVSDMLIGHIEDEKDTETFKIEYSTLLARPIIDMTDEELIKIRGANVSKITEEERRRMIHEIELSIDYNMMYGLVDTRLTDISVYPFDQSHFKNGTVIYIAPYKYKPNY